MGWSSGKPAAASFVRDSREAPDGVPDSGYVAGRRDGRAPHLRLSSGDRRHSRQVGAERGGRNGDDVELRELLAALRAAWWLPLVGLVVGGGAALLVSLLQTPLYTSSTQLFVSTRDSASTSDVFQGSQFSQQRVTSYAQLITGDELASRVINRLNLDMPTSDLRGEITATAATDTVLIDVAVTDPSPQRTRDIAEAVGTEFTAFATELETTDPGGPSPVKVTVTQPPQVPDEASSPNTTRNVALGG